MIYSFESGDPQKPSIVFLHGGGLSSKSWLPVIERLPDFHCLAPDLPGHGQSKDRAFHIDEAACCVADIIRQHTPYQKAHVVGLSLGGPVALTLLRTDPELVDHAVLSGSSGKISSFMAALGRSMLWIYKLYNPEKLMKLSLREHGIPPQYENLVRDDLLAGSDTRFLGQLTIELSTWEVPQVVKQPLLLAVGEKEPSAARGISKGYLKRFPMARGVIVPGARHGWCLQFPDLFADMVRAWVTDQPLPDSLKPF